MDGGCSPIACRRVGPTITLVQDQCESYAKQGHDALIVGFIRRRKRPGVEGGEVLAAFHFVDLPVFQQATLYRHRATAGGCHNATMPELSLGFVHFSHSLIEDFPSWEAP